MTTIESTTESLICRRGNAITTTPTSARAATALGWRRTTSASVLTKARVQELHAAGALPDPRDLLLARLRPAAAGDWTLRLKVLFQGKAAATSEFPFEADPSKLDPDGAFSAAFVFAYGPEDLGALSFPYIHVVDVSEGSAHAPQVELTGPGSQAVPITLEPGAPVEPPPDGVLECVCIPGVTFEFDSSFLRPSVVDHLKAIDAALAKHPQGRLFIVGHTDRVGEEQYNKDLSDRRAYSTYAFMTNDAAAWELLYTHEHWGAKKVQIILKDLGHDPGTIDGDVGPRTRAAMRSFLGLPEGAPVQNDAPFRAKLFRAYMTGKHDVAVTEERFMLPRFTGCSELNPVAPPNAAELANTADGNEANRRVVVFVLAKDEPEVPCKVSDLAPCRAQVALPGERKFACAFYEKLSTRCGCEGKPPPKKTVDPPKVEPPKEGKAQLRVRVIKNDNDASPFAGATVALYDVVKKAPAGAWSTNAQGWVEGIEVDAGTYSVQVAGTADWTAANQRMELVAGEKHTCILSVREKVHVGTILATVDRGPDEVDPSYAGGVKYGKGSGKITVTPEPFVSGAQRTDSADLVNGKGSVSFDVRAGEWLVRSDVNPFIVQVTVVEGKTITAAFAWGTQPSHTIDEVPWNTYFNQQFPICYEAWLAFTLAESQIPKGVPIPGVDPNFIPDAQTFIIDCMLVEVRRRVAADDVALNRKPRNPETKAQLKIWLSKNLKKFDGLPGPPPKK